MANFTLVGIIDAIKFLPNDNGCLLFVSEFKRGYKKSNGDVVDDKYLSWRIIYKQGLVKYINNHFSRGMVVEIKGEVLPYAVVNGDIVEGYSVMGQTLNMYSYPRRMVRQEHAMQKESQLHANGVPDVDAYNADDF